MLIKQIEEQATYYRKEQKVYKYANEFFRTICKCGDITKVRNEILPLYCYNELDEFILAVEKDSKIAISGGMQFCCKKQAAIRIGINGDNDILNPKLKRTIRHEITHYFLWLMELPCQDDSIEFWSYCHAFDAGAYKRLQNDDKVFYNNFVEVYDKNIKDLPENVKYSILQAAIQKISTDIAKEEFENQVIDDINKLKMFLK